MLDYSAPEWGEVGRLLHEFCEIDPEGYWDENEWQAFLAENASDEIRQFIRDENIDFSDHDIEKS